ncbi:winged helix-turn-helix domain-containing protein [Exiguobacterium acetylicum]|uniref:winged helix-turn-helix domain-containing protein n=1 Tax=Exiguobacterium acetylicum TaxID=41170 RepID=UPI0039774C41
MAKSEYKAGDTLVLRLRKDDDRLMEWAVNQSELGDAIRHAVNEEILRNGLGDVAMEIPRRRPQLPHADMVKESLYRLIKEKGEVRPSEAYERLAVEHNLGELERSIPTRTGNEPKWHNIVRWAKEKLKHEGLVMSKEDERGIWILTENGEKSQKYLVEDNKK